MAVKKTHFPFPFEYCSVSRTAKLFDCEVDDIWHLLRTEKIKAYIDLDEYQSHENYGCDCYVLIYEKNKSEIEKIKSGNAISLNNSLTRVLLRAPAHSEDNNQVIDGKNYSFYMSALHIGGFIPVDYWFLFNKKSSCSMVEHEQDNFIICFSLHDDRNPRIPKNEKKCDSVESLRNQIKHPEDEIFILRSDLESVFKALNSGQPMPRKANRLTGKNTGNPDSFIQSKVTDNEIDKMKITIAGLTLLLSDTKGKFKTGDRPNIAAIHSELQGKVAEYNAQLANERSKNLNQCLIFLKENQ